MGNWRSVEIIGSCNEDEVEGLTKFIDCSDMDFDDFCCLSFTGGLSGLPIWPAERINAVGNLAERGYDEESVAECLKDLRYIAPSLNLKVHLGGDNESKKCVATIVLKDSKVEIDEPQIEKIAEVTNTQMQGNLMAQLMRQQRR